MPGCVLEGSQAMARQGSEARCQVEGCSTFYFCQGDKQQEGPGGSLSSDLMPGKPALHGTCHDSQASPGLLWP